MVDKSALGAEGTPFPLVVERGKIGEFARATHSEHPDYQSPDAVIPPIYLECMRHWADGIKDADPWPLVKIDEERGMHAEQEYIFHGPPPSAGDELTVHSRISEIYEKEGRRGGKMTFMVMVTEFRDASGKVVAEAKRTAVETEAK